MYRSGEEKGSEGKDGAKERDNNEVRKRAIYHISS